MEKSQTTSRLHSVPAEDLQNIAAGESKMVGDTFKAADNFSTTPVVKEDQRQTGEIKGASDKLRGTSVAGYPSDAK